jgi:hypothetical protein
MNKIWSVRHPIKTLPIKFIMIKMPYGLIKITGVYFVKLSGYGLCSRDSDYIKKGAIVLAKKLTKIMNFKSSYEYIDVEYENISYGGPNNTLNEQPVCINIVRLPIANLSLAYLRERINTHDNTSGPNSYRNLIP